MAVYTLSEENKKTMTEDALLQLHDKATRDETLTAEEETELAAWYARLDQEENALLTSSSPSLAPDALRDKIKKTLMRLEVTAQQIRAQVKENDVLRQDIAALSNQSKP